MERNHPAILPAEVGVSGAKSRVPEFGRQGDRIEKSYSESLQRLWAMKWTLLKVIGGGAFIALMIGAVETPLYRLHASLEIQEMNGKFTNASNSTDTAGEPSDRVTSDVQTQMRILTSRALVERTVSKLPETERTRLLDLHRLWKKATYDQSIESIVNRLEAHPSKQARIVDVSFLCPDATAGAAFLNALSQEVEDYSLERRWKTSQRTQAWLERELDDFRQKLEQSEREADEYARVSGLSNPQADARTVRPTVPVGRNSSEVAVALAADKPLKALRLRLDSMTRQMEDMEAIYSAQNQNVVRMKNEISGVKAAYDRRKALLTAQFRQRAPEPAATRIAGDDSGRLAHYKTLQQEVETNQRLFDAMSARMKDASVAAAMQANNISIVDAAFPTTKAVSPNQWINALLGAAAGLLVGLVYIAAKNRFSPTFTGPASVNRYLGIPLLGAIPIDRYTQQLPVLAPGVERGTVLHLAFDKGLQTAESYRSIRSSILNSLAQRNSPWRLLFSSAGPGEGKTSVISNLGAALAGAQRKVLLIDGDLRHPTLHEIFGMENENGLAEFLAKRLSTSAADSRRLIRATQIPGLYLLSAGRPGVNAPEVLASEHLALLLRELVKGFDLVLVDSPPILPYSDARSLARHADGAILVIRANATERQAAVRALETLTKDGVNIVGAILTDWNADSDTLRFQTGYQEAV